MMNSRVTVTFTTADYPEPREFHLWQAKAEAFAASVIKAGGTASIGPLKLGSGLAAMLARAGVDLTKIK